MQNLDRETIELAFIVVTGLSLFVQTIVLLMIFAAMRKATKSVKDELDELRASVVPVIADTKQLIARFRPSLESAVLDLSGVVADLKEMSQGLKRQAQDVEAAAAEILQRVQHQSSRVDSMISTALDGVDKASGFVVSAVNKPVRQAAALLASAKAIIGSLRESKSSYREPTVPDDIEPSI